LPGNGGRARLRSRPGTRGNAFCSGVKAGSLSNFALKFSPISPGFAFEKIENP